MNRAFIRILAAALSLLLMLSPLINAAAAAGSNPVFDRELKQGDEGEDVRALQERLQASAMGLWEWHPGGSRMGSPSCWAKKTSIGVLRFQLAKMV